MPTLEELFDRFRRAGDADALGEVYDRVAAQVLRSAMHVAPSPASAEDLLQATFVAAIERRDSYDATRPLVPWLLGILANQARLLRWRDGRTPDPQRIAPASARDPLELAQETEFTAALDEAIAALPEVYQPVLVLHLRHGMPGIEIAHALRRPPGTVRAQLARGLDKLRAALPAGIAGGLAISASASRGLAAVRAAVLAHASTASTPAIAALAAPSVWGFLAMKKALLALAAGAAVLGLWWASDSASGSRAAAPLEPPGGVTVAAHPEPSPADSGAPAREREELAPATTVAATASSLLDDVMPELHGVVRFAGDRTPASGVSVWCQDPLDSEGERLVTRADDRGAFTFGRRVTLMYRIGSDRGGEEALYLDARTGEVELLIPAGCLVTGTVRDADRRPVSGAQIWLSDRHGLETGGIVAASDDDGRFRIRDVSAERYVGARADGYRPSHVCYVQEVAGGTMDLDLTLVRGDARLRGRVFDALGQPVSGARVRVAPPGRAPYVTTGDDRVVREHAPAITVSAKDGAFELGGLPPGWLSVQARAAGHGAFDGALEIAAGATGQVTATLPDVACVRGKVTGPDGNGVGGVQVRAALAWDDFLRTRTSTNVRGEFTLEVVAPGETALAVLARGRIAAQTMLTVAPGQTARWDPVLGARPAITGRVVDSARRPLSGWRVSARRGNEPVANAVTDEDGRFALFDLEPERHEIWVSRAPRPSATSSAYQADITALVLQDITPDGTEMLLEIPDALVATSGVRGRALAPDGTAMAQARISIGHLDGKGVIWVRADPQSGAFEVSDLIPGDYWISAHADGYPPITVGTRVLGAGLLVDLGELSFTMGGSVVGALRGVDPEVLARAKLEIVDASQHGVGNVVHEGDRFRSSDLLPGRYRLLLRGPGLSPCAVPFEISAGVETTCDIEASPGSLHPLRARLPEGEPPPRWLWMTLMRDQEMLGGQGFEAQPDGSYTTELWLGQGTYQVWIGDPGSRCLGTCTLTATAGSGAAPETSVQLERT